jgi:hypothetical protein
MVKSLSSQPRAGFSFTYDIAGNRTQEQVTIGMTTTTTHWTYNNANQISTMQIGSNPITHFTYDANGNMSSEGVTPFLAYSAPSTPKCPCATWGAKGYQVRRAYQSWGFARRKDFVPHRAWHRRQCWWVGAQR